MGYSPELARSAVRFSYGHLTTAEEIDYAIGALADAVYRLRGDK
jgi:cysteine sulfinate desulfinase/cysteine desulfurase-like protein